MLRADGGQVKLVDLGLALLAAEERSVTLTKPGALMGTAAYLAPEQGVNAHGADIRADLYSLGCTLYHLLAGRPPFSGKTATEVFGCHLHKTPPALRELRPDVPPGLEGVLRKLLAKKPEQRYQTPAELAAALEPFTDKPG
jgi:serine/threonine-protein kinase